IFKIAIVLAPLMVVAGGAIFMTSAGDPKKTTTAKQLILFAAIGFLVIMLAKGFVSVLKQILGAS
ncbi:MAG: hypothetical protein Q7K28_01950, partial [Candidatus Wildermuthbacteria bacterium]|nr:hypothetical protein [Candidatus Wildermuthbacteria bacterium]